MASRLSYGQVDVYLSSAQEIALQAAAHQSGITTVGELLQHVIWGMAADLLADAGAQEGDSGPTVYDKVRAQLMKEEAARGC